LSIEHMGLLSAVGGDDGSGWIGQGPRGAVSGGSMP
jgi:hypothetical protein